MSRRGYRWIALGVSAAIFYVCLFVADFFLYELGRALPIPADIKDYLTSRGAFDQTSHPDYRRWLRAFVTTPGQPWEYEFRGDIVKVLRITTGTPARKLVLPVDDLGFVNQRPPADAEVLFLGDSFGRSAGCTFEETIPSFFEAIAGKKVYNASMQGYGLHQYVSILNRLTDDAGNDPHHFHGKEVYVLVYVGNDLKENIDDYQERVAAESRPMLLPRLQLETLRSIGDLTEQRLRNALRPWLGRNRTLSEEDFRTRTDGFYPVFLDLPPYRDVPVAFEPRLANYRTIDWLDAEREKVIESLLDRFRTLASERELTIRFAILPVNVQVLGPHVIHDEMAAHYSFYGIYRPAAESFDKLAAFMKNEIGAAGFEVLDLTPALRAEAQRTQVYWPEDTHLTPIGNRVVAEELARTFGSRPMRSP